MNFHLAVILIYSAAQILLGVIVGRWVKTTGAFFVAGRSLPPLLLFATLLAANIGAGSTVGATALGYRLGISAWWWVGSAGVGTFALAFWVGPRIWRVAKDHDLQTMGDFLELRYGGTVRGVVASLLWVATLFVLAAQLIALARVLEAVADVPKVWGAIIGGGVITAYFTAGGLLSSVWVNLVQVTVKYVGFVLALPIALGSIGGLGAIRDLGATVGGPYLDPWVGGARFLALLAPAFIISPGLIQKVYGARDERTVRLAVSLCAVALLIFAWIPALLGMVARVHFPDLSSPDLALPTLLMERMPLLLGTLGLAAIFSAEVSAADAALFMLATSLSRDLYLRFLRPQATDASVLRAARVAAIVGGALGVVIALVFETVIDTLTIFYSILSVSLFVPVVAGLHYRRTGAVEAFAAIGAGVATLLAVHLRTGGQGYGIWTPTLLGMAVSAVAYVLGRRR
ncbi:MAG TPA: sodium:solute symporter family protein [Vicinamibacteria bacterium]